MFGSKIVICFGKIDLKSRIPFLYRFTESRFPTLSLFILFNKGNDQLLQINSQHEICILIISVTLFLFLSDYAFGSSFLEIPNRGKHWSFPNEWRIQLHVKHLGPDVATLNQVVVN